jgi:hypothetical protein
MNIVYNFYEYKHAKQLVEEIPRIQKELDKIATFLQNYTHYVDVVSTLWAINETQIVLNAKYEYYKKIYNNKAILLIQGGNHG